MLMEQDKSKTHSVQRAFLEAGSQDFCLSVRTFTGGHANSGQIKSLKWLSAFFFGHSSRKSEMRLWLFHLVN